MLEPDPAKRLQSMAEVRDWVPGLSPMQGSPADATIVLQHGTPVQSAIVGLPERPPVLPLVSGHGAKPERAPERQGPRRLFLLLGGALAVVLALGVLASVVFIDRDRAVEEEPQPATMHTDAESSQKPGKTKPEAPAAKRSKPTDPETSVGDGIGVGSAF
jgi:hypothetical protein